MPFDNKAFRRTLGFTNQITLQKYYKAKDVVFINWNKIEKLNERLKNIFESINGAIHPSIRWNNIGAIHAEIDSAYAIMRQNDIFPRLNNNGRCPEDVYYNWMRGYIVCKFFASALAIVFGVPEDTIRIVGHDSLSNIKTFSQSPVADLELIINDQTVRLEIQSGYTGVNDIKAHKVREAKRAFLDEQTLSYVVHFDLFNGTVAIVNITDIDDKNIHWEKRYRMEGKPVFSIPEEAFRWFLPNEVPNYIDILF